MTYGGLTFVEISLQSEFQHRVQLCVIIWKCAVAWFCHVYIFNKSITTYGREPDKFHKRTSYDLTWKHDIIHIYTNNTVLLLDILGLQAPGQATLPSQGQIGLQCKLLLIWAVPVVGGSS